MWICHAILFGRELLRRGKKNLTHIQIYQKLECIEWFLLWLDPDLNCRISLIRGPNLPLFSSVHLYIIFKKSGISFSFSVIPCQVNHYGLHVTDFAEILHTIRDVKKIPEPEDERSDLKLKKNFGAISKNKKKLYPFEI